MADQVPTSESKEWAKALKSKVFEEKDLMELAAKPESELLDLVSLNAVHVRKLTDELNQIEAYQKAALVVKDLKGGLRDTLKPTLIASAVAVRILKDRKAGTDF